MNYKVIGLIVDIITSIGSLSTFGAFIFLFRRDKDKQAQIDKLTGIARVLEAQNDTMKLQNDLIAQQVNIFRNTSILKGSDNEAIDALTKIEEQRLRLSVMPSLWLNGAGYNGSSGELYIDLNNKGENARLIEFKLLSGDLTLHNSSLPYNLERGQDRKIFGKYNGTEPIQYCKFEIEIIYTDKLKNKYSSKVQGIGSNVKLDEAISVKK